LDSAVRLLLGCLFWSFCIGLNSRVAQGLVLAVYHPVENLSPVLGLALAAAGIAVGVGIGWLAARIAIRLRLDWPHWSVPALLVCAVLVGLVIAGGGGGSPAGAVFVLLLFGPVLIGAFLGVLLRRSL